MIIGVILHVGVMYQCVNSMYYVCINQNSNNDHVHKVNAIVNTENNVVRNNNEDNAIHKHNDNNNNREKFIQSIVIGG